MSRSTTKKLTLVAVLSAISFVLTIFPQVAIIPSASFLKIDFSIVPAFLALEWLGLGSAVWVLVIRTVLKLILFNEGPNTYIGLPVNLVLALTFVIIVWLVRKGQAKADKGPTAIWQGLAAVLSTLALTVMAFLVNIVWAIPLYARFANFDIAKFIGTKVYLWTMVVPFNLVEGLIWFIVSALIVTILSPFKKSFHS
ncbi:ECF transporter S component [Fructobacillus ficulneus]|uniref:Riboflavin transporter n=1 Tax=Fructobacillus ficulneus TaxID=157463 RepID=A0A0K8MIH1_9LACO|nr:ECF transporter S component [Fructobacillus ficulneus]GAP00253.1 hypothetical protein FFIC_282670 [Fructobacillus ficulneus]